MPAREINPFTALARIRSQFLRTQWSTSNHSEWTRLRIRPLSHRGWTCFVLTQKPMANSLQTTTSKSLQCRIKLFSHSKTNSPLWHQVRDKPISHSGEIWNYANVSKCTKHRKSCEKMHMALFPVRDGLSQHSSPIFHSPKGSWKISETCAEINPSRTRNNAICLSSRLFCSLYWVCYHHDHNTSKFVGIIKC